MTTQFFELSSIFSNPSAVLQQNEHQKLLQEFERVKQSENGWKDCAQLLVGAENQTINEQTKFFCMQIIESYLKLRYKDPATPLADQQLLKQFMSTWLQMQVNRKANEKNYITKKAAQLFSLVALVDFPARWPTFFQDLMVTAQWSVGNADFYLKVLLAIHFEIVDRELPRTPEEASLIAFFKDSIRERCMEDLVSSWFALLQQHADKAPEIACQTLEVIGCYVSWIDINLVVAERFVQFVSFALAQQSLRESACSCLEEVVNKGMDFGAKLKLIEFLWTNVIEQHALKIQRTCDDKRKKQQQQQMNGEINNNNRSVSNGGGGADSADNDDDDDDDTCDYLLKFGKLLNTIGENLFEGWQKSVKKDMSLAMQLVKSLEDKLPYVLTILSHSDDDICESVSEYCMHYISIMKSGGKMNMQQLSAIENMLNIVIAKTRYDPSFNFEFEGEDEAMFLEFRKNIKSVFDAIAQLDNDLVLTTVKNLVLDVCAKWRQQQQATTTAPPLPTTTTTTTKCSFIDVENALYLLYLIGEALPSQQGNHFAAQRTPKSDALCEMLQASITSEVVKYPHRIVKFQYFEIISRYCRFFQLYPQYLEPVVEHFVGEHGLHHPDAKLRSRVSYLFSRFTRDLKNLVSQYVEKILSSIQDLLVINCNKTASNNGKLIETSENQFFIYETVSVLIVTSNNIQPAMKAQLMRNLLAPTISSFSMLLAKYCETVDEKDKLALAQCLNTAMQVASRSSKGFSTQVKVKDCMCVDIFVEILRIFIPVINITTHKQLLQAGVRQYLHRMIVCLDPDQGDVLQYIEASIDHLLKLSNEPRDLHDLLPLVNQIMTKYKQSVVRFMQAIFAQLVDRILQFVTSVSLQVDTTTTGDIQLLADAQMLYKSYFTFLFTMVNTELVLDVVGVQEPACVYKVMNTLVQGAQSGTQETPKVALQIMKKFITVFLDNKQAQFPEFVQYTLQNVVPCCFQIFSKPSIDLNDAQTVLTFNEIGQCLILLYSKYGDDFIKYLEATYLPSLPFSPQLAQGIVQTIKANNPKGFKNLRESLAQQQR